MRRQKTSRDPIFATIAAHQKAAAALTVVLQHKWRLEDKLGGKAYDGHDPQRKKRKTRLGARAMRRHFASLASSRRRWMARLRCSTTSLTSVPTTCHLSPNEQRKSSAPRSAALSLATSRGHWSAWRRDCAEGCGLCSGIVPLRGLSSGQIGVGKISPIPPTQLPA